MNRTLTLIGALLVAGLLLANTVSCCFAWVR
jgi:hypothetical protein